jgi:hypothetical protein
MTKYKPQRYTIHAHKPGSDYYGGRADPSFTLWPNGAILSGISRPEARVIVDALNDALRSGKLLPQWKEVK